MYHKEIEIDYRFERLYCCFFYLILVKLRGMFLFAFIAACIYAFNEILGKYIADKNSEPLLVGILINFYALCISLIFSLFQPIHYVLDSRIILGLISAGLIYALGTFTYYYSLKLCPISEFTLLTRASVVLIALGGVLIFKDPFTPLQILGGLLIIAGSIVISWRGRWILFHKGSLLALLTAFLFAVGALIDKSLVNNFSAAVYQVISYFLMTIFLLPSFYFLFKTSKKFPSKKSQVMIFISAFCFASAGFFLLKAYQSAGLVSYVNLITQLRIPIVVVYGLLVFHEKERIFNKLLAVVLIILGTYFIH